jgi:DNA-binding LytR/AlgR family response regulator
MPELDGIQFLKLLKGRSKVILTTAYSKYALEGYEHDIVDYLLKPIVFDRFLKAVQKAIGIISTHERPAPDPNEIRNENEFIFVKTDGRSKMVKVVLKDIEYIEARGNYVSIHTASSKIITLLTIKELEEKLPAPQFIRIHNSYIIPVKKITEVEGNQVQVGKQKLPIGDVYKKTFLNTIEKYLVKNKK